MIAIKPKKPNKREACTLDIEDPFYKYSHAYDIMGLSDYTLCGVGSEEYREYKKVKNITCPQCRAIINECKNYRGQK